MGLALAAELNGYPGPMHAIELADRLTCRRSRSRACARCSTAMKAETIPIGARLIAQERSLNEDFAQRTVTPRASRPRISRSARRTSAGLTSINDGSFS